MKLEIDAPGDNLRIRLTSDGPLTETPGSGAGIGLDNVRQRLASLFGGEGHLQIESVEGDRTQVLILQPRVRETPA